MDKLKQIKQILKRKKIHGIALDIDETLSATFRNWVERLLEEHNDEGLTTEEMMAKYRYFRDVPYWQNDISTSPRGRVLSLRLDAAGVSLHN